MFTAMERMLATVQKAGRNWSLGLTADDWGAAEGGGGTGTVLGANLSSTGLAFGKRSIGDSSFFIPCKMARTRSAGTGLDLPSGFVIRPPLKRCLIQMRTAKALPD
jgi:hypothetical protein